MEKNKTKITDSWSEKGESAEEKLILEGMEIINAMSQVNINELIDRVDKESPSADRKRAKDREKIINWEIVAFDNFGANECRLAWNYLMSNTRKYRIMSELVAEIRLAMVTKKSRHKFFIDCKQCLVKPPKVRNACDIYVREKWDEHVFECAQSNQSLMNYLKFRNIVSRQYAELPEEDKQNYKKGWEMASKEYNKKLEEFCDRFPEMAANYKTELTSKRKKSETKRSAYPDAPKFPVSAQAYFLQDKLQKLEFLPQQPQLSELKAKYIKKYQKLKEKKKAKWIDHAIDSCENYKQELKEYIEHHPEYSPPIFKIKNIIKKTEVEIWEKTRDMPMPRPPKTVYSLFEDNFLKKEENAHLPQNEARSLADAAFKELDWYTKEQCQIDFKMAMMNYKQSIQEFYDNVPSTIKPLVLESIPKKFHPFLGQVDKSLSGGGVMLDDHEAVAQNEISEDGTGSNQTHRKNKKRKKVDVAAEDSCGVKMLESVSGVEDDEIHLRITPKKKKKRRMSPDGDRLDAPEESHDFLHFLEDVNLKSPTKNKIERSADFSAHTEVTEVQLNNKSSHNALQKLNMQREPVTLDNRPPKPAHENLTRLKVVQSKRGF